MQRLLALLLPLALACSGGSTDADAGTSADASSACRFDQPACKACITSSCPAQASACYGADWASQSLCSKSGASKSCTTATSAMDGLTKQTAYANCLLGCTSNCR